MGLTFQHPELFWGLLGLPLVFLTAWRSRALHSVHAKIACSAVRSALLALLIFALAAPFSAHRRQLATRPAVVFVVDHSDSVQAVASAVDNQIELFKEALASDVRSYAMAFAQETWPLGAPPAGASNESDIEGALTIASSEFPDSPNRQLVLFTDGRATTGDATEIVRRLGALGTVTHVVPIGRVTPRGLRVTGLTPPAGAAVGQPARVEVRLASDWPVDVEVRLLDSSGIEHGRRRVSIDGERALVLNMQPQRRGVEEAVILVSSTADRGQQQSQSASFFVEGAPKLLLVDPYPDELDYLREALGPLRVDIDTVTLDRFPATVQELSAYETIIISDCPSPQLDESQTRALVSFVDDRGGGLVFIGGSNVKTAQWHDSDIEKLLPIAFIPEREQTKPEPQPSHVCYVLDRSGSMAGGKLDLVKAALARSLDNLPPGSTVSVVAFDNAAHVVVDSEPIGNKASIVAKVNSISVGGGTTMGPAVQRGLDLLSATPDGRYMILLTDGETTDMADRIWTFFGDTLRHQRISVTGIAVGPGASQTVLRYLARKTGGSFHDCRDITAVPSIFIEEADSISENAQRRAISFQPKPGPDVKMLRSIALDRLPELGGCVAARARANALVNVQLVRDQREVLLASWRYGLGRVVAFTGGVKPAWAQEWIQSPQTARFWTEVVHWTMGNARAYQADAKLRIDDRRVRIVMRVVESETGTLAAGLSATGTLKPMSGDSPQVSDMRFREIRSGVYEFVGTCSASGNHLCAIRMHNRDELAIEFTSVVRPSRIAELAQTGPDDRSIAALCDAGGGLVNPSPTEIADRARETKPIEARTTVQHWPLLLLLATCLWPIDVALRRLLNNEKRAPSPSINGVGD